MDGKRLYSRMMRLIGDIGGNMLPLGAMGIIIAAALIGGGVDMGRAYLVKNRLQAACDAAVLAGRRAVTSSGYDTSAQTQASTYFAINFDRGSFGARSSSFSTVGADSGNTITGTASAVVDTTIMRLFGRQDFNLAATCISSMGVGNSDVMLVLDTTGSMDWTLSGTTQTRIQALRTAMKNFRTTLATATAGSNARVRYGFVPYSSAVNVGALLYAQNPDYIVDSHTIQSRVANWTTSTVRVRTGWGDPSESSDDETQNSDQGDWSNYGSTIYPDRDSCSAVLPNPNPTAWVNNGTAEVDIGTAYINGSGDEVQETTTTQPQSQSEYRCQRINSFQPQRRMQVRTNTRDLVTTVTTTREGIYEDQAGAQTFSSWSYQPVVYSTSVFKTFASVVTQTGSSGANRTSTWAGCIEERATISDATFSFNSLTGISPDADDLDIDSAPTSAASTKWAPMWPEVAYYRTDSSGSYLSNSSPGSYGSQASSACPRPARLLATMTQTEFDAYADALTPDGSTYHDIGMVWGARLASPDGIFAANVNAAPPNGGNVSRHIVFMTDGEMSTNYSGQTSWGIEYHDRRVTDDGYTGNNSRHTSRFLAICEAAKAKGIRVWTIAFAAGTTPELTTCATSASSFTVSNATQLNSAFQEIAKQVGELRVVQ
jgi:Flp pilus assembly protein TadG